MKIITIACEECGTVVAGNVLESKRVLKCPGLDCTAVHRFSDLPDEDRQHIINNKDAYRMDS